MPTKLPRFFGLHAEPSRGLRLVLAILPFVLLIGLYLIASNIRNTANPQDKLLPTVPKIVKAFEKSALQTDKRSHTVLLWRDTYASLKRLAIGMSAAAAVGLVLGLNMGLLPGLSSLGLSFITFIANIPPLAILPILFITFGVDERGEVAMISRNIKVQASEDASESYFGGRRIL